MATLDPDPAKLTCSFCGGTKPDLLCTRAALQVFRCKRCGIVHGETAKDDVGPAVPTDPSHFAFGVNNFPELVAENSNLLAKRMPMYRSMCKSDPKLWLEIGPGSGAYGEAISRFGGSWVGVEIDPDMARRAMELRQNVMEADFSGELPSKLLESNEVRANGGYDVVYFSQVLEHVTNPESLLKNVLAALRPGGTVHIDVPNHDGLTGMLRKLNWKSFGFGEIVPPHHMIAYNKKSLRALLQRTGFENIQPSTCAYSDDTFGLAHARLSQSSQLHRIWKLSRALRLGGNLLVLANKPN
jgi:SAM-dependent methyltransferase